MNAKAWMLACLLVSSNSLAAPILDQRNEVRGLGAALAEGFAYVGQTVTAGVGGALVAVEIDAIDRQDFAIPWVIDVIRVTLGQVTGEVLTSAITSLPSPNGFEVPWQRVEFSTPAHFLAGESFAITIHPEGITGQPGLLAGSWGGGIGNPYPRGEFIAGLTAGTLAETLPTGADLNFRTFVEPIPEPTMPWLVFGAFAALRVSRYVSGRSSPHSKSAHLRLCGSRS